MPPTASTLLNRLLARGKFRHLQLVLKLAELGSVQKTADSIGVTQSSVTQTLAYVEELAETQLFQRHARGVRPTPTCMDLLPVARQILQGITDGAEVIAARQRKGQGLVRLIASAATINGMLASALIDFNRRVPSIEVHLREAEGDDQLLAIARGEADLVACRQPAIIPEGWTFVPVMDDEIIVVGSSRHPLARRRLVSEADLAREIWILVPAGLVARQRFDEFVAKLPAMPRTLPLVTRNQTLLTQLLEQHSALCMLPASFVRNLIERGEMARVSTRRRLPMLPLGLLQPASALGEATARLSSHLAASVGGSRPARRPAAPRRP